MNIKDQVVSLGLAKELKELGVKQDSLWYWTWAEWNEEVEWVLISQDKIAKLKREYFSAFTVAELGEMLTCRNLSLPVWNKYNMGAKWFVDLYTVSGYTQVNEATEADARAKMLIYLLKESILTVEGLEK